MIELAAGLRLEDLRLMPVLPSLKKVIMVWRVRIPRAVGLVSTLEDDPGFSVRSINWTVLTVNRSGMLLWSIRIFWPGAKI
jgi:hypothetical protein